MRRVHLRGRNNVLERLLVHGAAFNLSLILRKTFALGQPRRLRGFVLRLLIGDSGALSDRSHESKGAIGKLLRRSRANYRTHVVGGYSGLP